MLSEEEKIWAVSKLLSSTHEKIVMLYILHRARLGEKQISANEFVNATAMTRGTLFRILSKLEEKRLISRSREAFPAANVYELCTEAIEPMEANAAAKVKASKARSEFNRKKGTLLRAMLEAGVPYICSQLDCDARTDLQLDHVLPLAKGGNNTLENLQFLCARHNNEKSDSTESAGQVREAE